MHGDRIDLGLGRAPGTDMMTAQALSRSSAEPQAFAQSIYDLQGWFSETGTSYTSSIVSAVSAGMHVPIWVLGSTVNGASIRSEEHTSELQSRGHLVCRLLLEQNDSDL